MQVIAITLGIFMQTNIFRRMHVKLLKYIESFSIKMRVMRATQHIAGPRKIRQAKDEVALVCMLKNGTYYVAELIKHHQSIGIENFLFIDNGSDDDTVRLLAQYKNVTVVLNSLPVAKYEIALRSQIARKIIKGGWFLFVDTDEMFDLINGENRNIKEVANYCNHHGYEVVIGQCLDLFSPAPMAETIKWSYGQSLVAFNLFSLGSIENFEYHDSRIKFSFFLKNNLVSNPNIKLKFGGIRKQLFNEHCALSVHRMVRNLRHTKPYTHPHCSSNTKCADFTILVRHYKFAGPYFFRENRQALENVWEHGEDKKRLKKITDLNFTFSGLDIQRFSDLKYLVDQGFLNCSDQYLKSFPFKAT